MSRAAAILHAVMAAYQILPFNAAAADACPGFFGYVNPDTMVVTDASTPGAFLINMTGDESLSATEPDVVMHYFPGVNQTPSVEMRKAAFGPMFLSNTSMCLMPGAPIVGQCGKYRKVEYANCDFPVNANLAFGGIDAQANYTVRGSSVDTSGLIKGCEDKVLSSTLYCFRRTASTAQGPPPAVDCTSCDSASSTESNSPDACPGFFGYVNPDTMVVTDASTPGAFLINMTGDESLSATEPDVVMHYFPGVNQTPSVEMRKAAFGPMFLSNTSMCLMPGAPIVGQCGKYRKVEYANCDFPVNANLAFGGIDAQANYTVRGSSVDTSGLIKGCEDKVLSSTLYCFRRTASTAQGPPPAVDCTSCDPSGDSSPDGGSPPKSDGPKGNSPDGGSPPKSDGPKGNTGSTSGTPAVLQLSTWAWQWLACTVALGSGM
eukprot:TRINITY_DN15151_c0_g1_i3.p1 TRINITY_DN15151_c0_g1~~TRINITY_DN15151_c0_g1_i3.p1  ORF type:complete len:448 (-),score=76.04 TRINITY_DN15151_c0_g1_i3:11-1306(-)